MSTTLNLADRLLARGRRYHELGRPHDALPLLRRLSGLCELPPDVAEEAQLRLGEILLARGEHRQARRHFTAALQHQPDHPRYHTLMARAADGDPEPDAERALAHYRRALELDDARPGVHAEYGRLLQRLGRVEQGLAALRRAADLAPDDPDVVGGLVAGLLLAGRAGEARDLLRAARFRNPRDGRFGRLWDDFQFQELRKEQEAERLERASGQGEDGGPVLLPFVRPEGGGTRFRRGGRILRLDPATPPRPPHRPPVPASQQRHAQ